MVRATANVVLVLISADGTISTVGPFISSQRAHRWLIEHPKFSDDEGFQSSVQRMDDPKSPEFNEPLDLT